MTDHASRFTHNEPQCYASPETLKLLQDFTDYNTPPLSAVQTCIVSHLTAVFSNHLPLFV